MLTHYLQSYGAIRRLGHLPGARCAGSHFGSSWTPPWVHRNTDGERYATPLILSCRTRNVFTAWTRLRAQLEPVIQEIRDDRYEPIQEERNYTLSNRLDSWRASLNIPTMDKLTYPRLPELHHFPEFVAFRELDCERLLTNGDYEAVLSALPRISSEFIEMRKSELQDMILQENITEHLSNPLELATSTFRPPMKSSSDRHGCSFNRNDVVVGWDALSVCCFFHTAPDKFRAAPCEFDPWLSKLCSSLVASRGLDPKTATVEDMDTLDERFLCGSCLLGPGGVPPDAHTFEFETYTWRTAVRQVLWPHPQQRSDSPDFQFSFHMHVSSTRNWITAKSRFCRLHS